MNCPACGQEMVEKDCGDVKIDVCKGCNGLWFDWSELSMLEEKNEKVNKVLEDVLNSPRVSDANRGPIKCPKCGINMHIHKYRSSKEVNVDECYRCGGFFLDSGELKAIRDTHMNKQEQEEYAQRLVKGMPLYRDSEKSRKRSASIKTFCKYLTQGYYYCGIIGIKKR